MLNDLIELFNGLDDVGKELLIEFAESLTRNGHKK